MSSTARYLLMYGKQKKKVEVKLDDGAAIKANVLKEKACSIFGVADIKMSAWDRGFDDWVDLDDTDDVENNTKILIDASTTTLEPSLDSSIESTDEPDTKVESDGLADTDPSKSSSLDSLSTPPSTSHVNWISTFQLPIFRSHIKKRLDDGNPLKEGERSAVLEAIYHGVTKYTHYPTSTQYTIIVDLLFKQFPKLAEQSNMIVCNAKALWKHRLQYKFANARKREDKELAVVVARKRKASTTFNLTKAKPTLPQWGMPNYLPERPPAEDDASISQHKEWMKAEMKKKKPNYERVELAMSATFADRRKLIVKDSATVATMKETYPWLFDEEEICKEFHRLQGYHAAGIQELLTKGLTKYGAPIVKVCKVMKKGNPSFYQAVGNIPLQRDEVTKRDATAVAAIIGLPALFNEKIRSCLVFENDSNEDLAAIYIMGKEGNSMEECTHFEVLVDEEVVGVAKNFMSAVSVYLAAYYVFNLIYPTSFKKTMLFIQKIILNIQDNLKMDRSLLSMLEKLNQHLLDEE